MQWYNNFEDNDIFKAKIKLAEELSNYDKIKNDNQIKALVDFLEYLFLIEDPELGSKYDAYKRERGGAFKMSIDEIRRIHYTGVGREEGREEGIEQLVLNQYKKGLDVEYIATINDLDINYVKKIVEKNNKQQE